MAMLKKYIFKKKKINQWILDSPLARSSLKGTVERDIVKGSLWRPTKEQKKHRFIVRNDNMEQRNATSKKNTIWLKQKSINHKTKLS